MPSPRPRKPRFRRVSPAATIRLTVRDLEILDLVSRHRFLRSDHICALIPGSAQHLVRRLGRLFHAGLLDRPIHQRRLPDTSGPFVYSLAECGRRELREHGWLAFPSVPRLQSAASAFQLSHDLRVSDVLVCLHLELLRVSLIFRLHHEWPASPNSADSRHLHPLRWSIRLRQDGRSQRVRVIPDGAFSIHSGNQSAAYFLLEVDRGTMPVKRSDSSQTSFLRKIHAYRQTRQDGVLWKRWGVPGFRVLVVTESRVRMQSLQRATAECFQHGRSTMFLFAVADELLVAEKPSDGAWENCSGEPGALFQQQPTDPELRQSLPADHS